MAWDRFGFASGRSTSMSVTSRLLLVSLGLTFWGLGLPLAAQRKAPQREIPTSLLLDVDNAATKKFATVQNHIRVGQLREAIELLQSIGDTHSGKLVATGEGRYVNVQNYAQLLTAGLPPEGLRIYRQLLDPALRPAFEQASAQRDADQLQRIVQQGYCCSFTDDALLALGDLAWDEGDLWRARNYWEQLLPPPPLKGPGEPVRWLAYPDSDIERPVILGRLILCSIHTGVRQEIARELREFERLHADATGSLAGKTGNLLKILQGVAAEAATWERPVQTSGVETFAGHPSRQQIEPHRVELGRLRWQVPLQPFGEEPRRGFRHAFPGALSYFPVVYGDVVLVNTDEQIQAYNLQTGLPAWSDDPTDPQIYATRFENSERSSAPRAFGETSQPNIGWPRFTMTIADGRLYARMGSLRPYSADRGGLLVCLDLELGEGKIVWETYASSIDPETGGWIFEGSPIVEQGRAYVALRRTTPQPQCNVACFDATNGKLIWNRKLCVGQTNPNFNDLDINQHLLTWGEGTLYYTSHMGAIAALDPQQGAIKWMVSYPRVEDTRFKPELMVRLQRGPLPAVFANGMLYAAPIDSNELLAFDAETGLLRWKRLFPAPLQSILGTSQGLVFVSGAGLWGVDVETGQIAWKVGEADPEAHGFGRGALVDDLIYWPTREEIVLVDQSTGGVRQRWLLQEAYGQTGGNLILTPEYLLLAQPQALVAFSDSATRPLPSKSVKPLLTGQPSPATTTWELARRFLQDQKWIDAADHYRLTRQLARSHDSWMGRSLVEVAREYEVDCRLRGAWELHASDPVAAEQQVDQALALAASGRNPTGQASDLLTTPTEGATPVAEASAGTTSTAREWHVRLPPDYPAAMQSWVLDQLRSRRHDSHTASADPVTICAVQTLSLPSSRARILQPVTHSNEVIARPSDEPSAAQVAPDWQPLWSRHWEAKIPSGSRLIVPTGEPSDVDLACLLLDRPTVSCRNLHDGNERWSLSLSYPVEWAGYWRDRLLIATAHEFKLLDLQDGQTVWRSQREDHPAWPRSLWQGMAAIELTGGATDDIDVRPMPSLPVAPWSDFTISSELLLVRRGSDAIQAWSLSQQRLLWQWNADRGFAPGWGLTGRHLVVCQQSPPTLVTVDLRQGSEVGRCPLVDGPWMGAPVMRSDGSFLTVGTAGSVQSWSIPGPAWQVENGPLAWSWTQGGGHSLVSPVACSGANQSLILHDGYTLRGFDSLQGTELWKIVLGTTPLNRSPGVICCDDRQVYVAMDGILRAFDLQTGELSWNRFVGPSEVAYRTQVAGKVVVTWPEQSGGASETAHLTVCDTMTGDYRQRMALPTGGYPVRCEMSGHTTLVACGPFLSGWRDSVADNWP